MDRPWRGRRGMVNDHPPMALDPFKDIGRQHLADLRRGPFAQSNILVAGDPSYVALPMHQQVAGLNRQRPLLKNPGPTLLNSWPTPQSIPTRMDAFSGRAVMPQFGHRRQVGLDQRGVKAGVCC